MLCKFGTLESLVLLLQMFIQSSSDSHQGGLISFNNIHTLSYVIFLLFYYLLSHEIQRIFILKAEKIGKEIEEKEEDGINIFLSLYKQDFIFRQKIYSNLGYYFSH